MNGGKIYYKHVGGNVIAMVGVTTICHMFLVCCRLRSTQHTVSSRKVLNLYWVTKTVFVNCQVDKKLSKEGMVVSEQVPIQIPATLHKISSPIWAFVSIDPFRQMDVQVSSRLCVHQIFTGFYRMNLSASSREVPCQHGVSHLEL